MIIAINALSYTSNRAGISNYIYNLIDQLSRLGPTLPSLFVYIPFEAKQDFEQYSDRISFRFLKVKSLASRILAEQLILPFLVFRDKVRILHSMANVVPIFAPCYQIVTIHDIYFVHDSRRFNLAKNIYLRLFISMTSFRANRIICVSKTTETDLVAFFPFAKGKTFVIYEGATLPQKPVSTGSNTAQPFILFVGTIEPGKNLANVVRAMPKLPGNYKLRIAGKWGWGCEDLKPLIKELRLENRIEFLDYVPDDRLEELYLSATCLILPSTHEGFGLPIIEAQNRGCPVCCSNTSCMPEIAGEGALYFNPYDVDSIFDALSHVLNLSIRNSLVQKGRINVNRFSWEQCAIKSLNLYNQETII